MKALVIGSTGLLGAAIKREMLKAGHEIETPSHQDLDITNPMSVAAIAEKDFDFIINGAAFSRVDLAENDPDAAYDLNALAPSYLAHVASLKGATLIHFSTDYVFDGLQSTPYKISDPTQPLNVYGRTKLEGEHAVLSSLRGVVVRTSWLFGPDRPCFPSTMIEKARNGEELRLVADQISRPTSAVALAKLLVQWVSNPPEPGLYHAVGPEALSWLDYATRAITTAGIPLPNITPISMKDLNAPAKRPKYSALDPAPLGTDWHPPLDIALKQFVDQIV